MHKYIKFLPLFLLWFAGWAYAEDNKFDERIHVERYDAEGRIKEIYDRARKYPEMIRMDGGYLKIKEGYTLENKASFETISGPSITGDISAPRPKSYGAAIKAGGNSPGFQVEVTASNGLPAAFSMNAKQLWKNLWRSDAQRVDDYLSVPTPPRYTPQVSSVNVEASCARERANLNANYNAQVAAARERYERERDLFRGQMMGWVPMDFSGDVERQRQVALANLNAECEAKKKQELAKEDEAIDKLVNKLSQDLASIERKREELAELKKKAEILREDVNLDLAIRDAKMRLRIYDAVERELSESSQRLYSPECTFADGRSIANLCSLKNNYFINANSLDNIEHDAVVANDQNAVSQEAEEGDTHTAEEKQLPSNDVPEVAHIPDPSLVNSEVFDDEAPGTYEAHWDRYLLDDEEVYVAWYEQQGITPEDPLQEMNKAIYGSPIAPWEYQGVLEGAGDSEGSTESSESLATRTKAFLADAFFNVESIKEAYAYIATTKSTDDWVSKYIGVPVAGMSIIGGVVDAGTNMATLGLKGLAGAAKKGIVQGSKRAVEKLIDKGARDSFKIDKAATRQFVKGTAESEKVILQAHAKALFKGREIRAVRSLSHLSEGELRRMAQKGKAPYAASGKRLHLHHDKQKYDGFLVEMPVRSKETMDGGHSIMNRLQHPFGNQKGMGLTKEQRAEFNKFREQYWKARAREELFRRGLRP